LRTAAEPEKGGVDAADAAKVADRPLTVDDLY